MKGTLFDTMKSILVGHEVIITGCSFIPNGTHAKVVGLGTTLKDVVKVQLIDIKTMKMFDLDVNNHQAMLELVK